MNYLDIYWTNYGGDQNMTTPSCDVRCYRFDVHVMTSSKYRNYRELRCWLHLEWQRYQILIGTREGQHGILIFSCLLFVLFEKTNPDFFVWSLLLCYTMVGLGIYCPKILCIQKIAEIGYFTIKNITNTHRNFLLNCESWQIFALI